MIARDEASRTAGMWSSVWMCAGMAGDNSLGTTDSCTLRSKICESARVEVDWLEAKAKGKRVGEAATKRLGGGDDEVTGFMFAGGAVGLNWVALGFASMTVLSDALSFFLTKPNRRRLLDFAESEVGDWEDAEGETIGAVSDCELNVDDGGEWARADMMIAGWGKAFFLFRQLRLSIKDKALARSEP